jgi:RNA 2',3'-cyclic 3'-phosphodiesterase
VTRAFVAVPLPEAVLDAVDAHVSELSVAGRVATRDQWHLTLRFLGDEVDVDAVVAALAGLDAEGGTARIGGAGAFPDALHARVLWLGLVEGADALARLATAVAARTAGVGHEPDPRPFRPHLTIARLRVAADVRDAIATLGAAAVGPAWIVDAVTVYESRRLPDGARYFERATIPLTG